MPSISWTLAATITASLYMILCVESMRSNTPAALLLPNGSIIMGYDDNNCRGWNQARKMPDSSHQDGRSAGINPCDRRKAELDERLHKEQKQIQNSELYHQQQSSCLNGDGADGNSNKYCCRGTCASKPLNTFDINKHYEMLNDHNARSIQPQSNSKQGSANVSSTKYGVPSKISSSTDTSRVSFKSHKNHKRPLRSTWDLVSKGGYSKYDRLTKVKIPQFQPKEASAEDAKHDLAQPENYLKKFICESRLNQSKYHQSKGYSLDKPGILVCEQRSKSVEQKSRNIKDLSTNLSGEECETPWVHQANFQRDGRIECVPSFLQIHHCAAEGGGLGRMPSGPKEPPNVGRRFCQNTSSNVLTKLRPSEWGRPGVLVDGLTDKISSRQRNRDPKFPVQGGFQSRICFKEENNDASDRQCSPNEEYRTFNRVFPGVVNLQSRSQRTLMPPMMPYNLNSNWKNTCLMDGTVTPNVLTAPWEFPPSHKTLMLGQDEISVDRRHTTAPCCFSANTYPSFAKSMFILDHPGLGWRHKLVPRAVFKMTPKFIRPPRSLIGLGVQKPPWTCTMPSSIYHPLMDAVNPSCFEVLPGVSSYYPEATSVSTFFKDQFDVWWFVHYETDLVF